MSAGRHINYLRCEVQQGHGRVTVRLIGELDRASAAIAHLALDRAGSEATETVLDLSEVEFLDAAGLRFLISAQRRARSARRRLIVCRPSLAVRRMLELSGVLPVLSLDDGDISAASSPAIRRA